MKQNNYIKHIFKVKKYKGTVLNKGRSFVLSMLIFLIFIIILRNNKKTFTQKMLSQSINVDTQVTQAFYKQM